MYRRVITALMSHQCADQKETEDQVFIRNCLNDEISCFGQVNEKAHLTGSAFIMDRSQRVLFTFHRKLNRWLQLGGHSESYERCLSQTAFREAVEESGLPDLTYHPACHPKLLDIDVHRIPSRAEKSAHYHLDFRYVFLTCVPERIVVSSESERLEWFSIEEALRLDIDPALARALGKLRGIGSGNGGR